MTIRPYRDADFFDVLQAWEESMGLDAPSSADFRRRVLLDGNRCPESLMVAEADGAVAGFLLALILRRPIEKTGLLTRRGFITAFGVRPEFRRRGVGSALLEQAEGFFRDRGRTEIAVAPYPPNYFIPGVDTVHYGEAAAFLRGRGFVPHGEALAMDASIGQFALPSELRQGEIRLRDAGIKVTLLPENRLCSFLEFMESVMPGDWVETARFLLRFTPPDRGFWPNLLVALDGEKIVGYGQFEGEHFGPFGVAETHQGRGIGTVLLARTLLQMRRCGHHAAYVLWTGERAAQGVYGRLGFRITRRFLLMKKTLEVS